MDKKVNFRQLWRESAENYLNMGPLMTALEEISQKLSEHRATSDRFAGNQP